MTEGTGTPKRRGRPPKPPVNEVQPNSVTEAIQAQQEESKKAVQELARSFAQLLLIGTVLAALAVDQAHVAMTRGEANAIATPLANIFSKTSLYRKYGKALTDSHDYVALCWALYQYSARVIEGWQHESVFNETTNLPPEYFATPNGNRAEPDGNVPNRSVNTNPFAGAPGISPKGGTSAAIPHFGRADI